MARPNQPERWESTMLASALAVVGSPYLFDKLATLAGTGLHSLHSLLNASPVMMVAAGAILLAAEHRASQVGRRVGVQGGQREL